MNRKKLKPGSGLLFAILSDLQCYLETRKAKSQIAGLTPLFSRALGLEFWLQMINLMSWRRCGDC